MLRIAAVGLGNRTCKYLRYVKSHPEKVRLVAVVDPDSVRLEGTRKEFGLQPECCFASFDEFITSDVAADAVIIGTPDRTHHAFAMSCMSRGWHVLLEKPAGVTERECRLLMDYASEHSLVLCVCYVLRYHPYYQKLKEVIDSVGFGRLLSVDHSINIGHDRMAHTFVRGLWSKEAESAPILLSKASHDIDLLYWLVGKEFTDVSSSGSLSRFVLSNAPQDSADRCVDCRIEKDCPYSAVDLYLRRDDWNSGFDVMDGESKNDAIQRELNEGRYGRCVYRCDNDVLDYQTVNMRTEDGCKVRVLLDGITCRDSRETVFRFEKGSVSSDGQKIVTESADGVVEVMDMSSYIGKPLHSGADMLIVEDFIEAVSSGQDLNGTDMTSAYHSHHVCFLAEDSRKS